MGSRAKILALLSTGIDGMLAARLLEAQGVEVRGVHFRTGFGREHVRGSRPDGSGLTRRSGLSRSVRVQDVRREFLDVVLRPRHGYGSAMNPCVDCRVFMLRKAGEIAEREGCEAIATGEVLGQHVFAQHRAALGLVASEAGVEGRVIRPLSAQRLPATVVEQAGRVDRSRLGALHGRSRRAQAALAARFAIREPVTPSGGCCLLADAGFARRFRDLVAHRGPGGIGPGDVELLRIGRHFRLAHDLKLVVARNEQESRALRERGDSRWTCQVASGRGAVALVDGEPSDDDLVRAARIAARYSTDRTSARVPVVLRGAGGGGRLVEVAPHPEPRELLV